MAIGGRYPSQRPYVGTETQTELVDALDQRLGISKAAVMRFAINHTFGLTQGANDGEVPRGKTFDELVAAGVALMTGEDVPEPVEQDGVLA
jgi:hypothetical protein